MNKVLSLLAAIVFLASIATCSASPALVDNGVRDLAVNYNQTTQVVQITNNPFGLLAKDLHVVLADANGISIGEYTWGFGENYEASITMLANAEFIYVCHVVNGSWEIRGEVAF